MWLTTNSNDMCRKIEETLKKKKAKNIFYEIITFSRKLMDLEIILSEGEVIQITQIQKDIHYIFFINMKSLALCVCASMPLC